MMRMLIAFMVACSIAAQADDVSLIQESCNGKSYSSWIATAKGLDQDNRTAEVIRAGWATTSSEKYLGYQDEAMAEGAGAWACKISSRHLYEQLAAQKNIHPSIVYGVAMTESGRNGKPWPWTINFAGKAFYFQTRTQAWQAASWLVDKGYTSFDVGPMQVNWKYHGWRFASLWDAFQPSVNIAAAIDFLQENYRETGNWATAVKWYHNRTDTERGRKYLSMFFRHFNAYIQS